MKIQKLTITALLISMCFIGANIKVMGSIAFDAAPAFIGTLLLGHMYGMLLGFLGHIVSSMISGFPLSFPVHLIVSLMMAITMLCYGGIRTILANRTSHLAAVFISIVIGFLLNCPFALLILYPLLKNMVFILFPALAIATICNIIAAELIYTLLPLKWKKRYITR